MKMIKILPRLTLLITDKERVRPKITLMTVMAEGKKSRVIMYHKPYLNPWKRLKLRLFRMVFEADEEWDCDGVSYTVKDRLTNGRIYYYHYWNFTKVGGSCGDYTCWFNNFYKKGDLK